MTITAKDARPGFFRFLHHDTPIEWSGDVMKRIEYIRTQKPPKEIPGRLAAMCRVPDEAISSGLWEARWAFEEAERARREAWRAYKEARRAYGEVERAYGEVERAYEKAWRAEWPD